MIQNQKNTLLSIGEVSKRSGVSISTLHFYEQKKLIFSYRNQANHRYYPRHMLRRIAIIKAARTLSLPLDSIYNALKFLPCDKAPSDKDWQKVSLSWQSLLTQKIERLTRLKNQLGFCIGCGCLSLDKCQLFNPDDQLGKNQDGSLL